MAEVGENAGSGGRDFAYDPDEALKLDNQLCFPLYAAAREVVRRYTPLLDGVGLTYTQYIVMMVLWEDEPVSVKELGARLRLDSGTLTPLLKKLEAKGLVVRERSTSDERKVLVSLTSQGRGLKEDAARVPMEMASCMNLTFEEAGQLKALLGKVMAQVDKP